MSRVINVFSMINSRLMNRLYWYHAFELLEDGKWVCRASLNDGIRTKTVWSPPMGTMSQAKEKAYQDLLPYLVFNILAESHGTGALVAPRVARPASCSYGVHTPMPRH